MPVGQTGMTSSSRVSNKKEPHQNETRPNGAIHKRPNSQEKEGMTGLRSSETLDPLIVVEHLSPPKFRTCVNYRHWTLPPLDSGTISLDIKASVPTTLDSETIFFIDSGSFVPWDNLPLHDTGTLTLKLQSSQHWIQRQFPY